MMGGPLVKLRSRLQFKLGVRHQIRRKPRSHSEIHERFVDDSIRLRPALVLMAISCPFGKRDKPATRSVA